LSHEIGLPFPSSDREPLQIGLVPPTAMRREMSRVSFLMCPFCVHGMLSVLTTENGDHERLITTMNFCVCMVRCTH
jgi:hypothetical protein